MCLNVCLLGLSGHNVFKAFPWSLGTMGHKYQPRPMPACQPIPHVPHKSYDTSNNTRLNTPASSARIGKSVENNFIFALSVFNFKISTCKITGGTVDG